MTESSANFSKRLWKNAVFELALTLHVVKYDEKDL
jgi:hypothetical protein